MPYNGRPGDTWADKVKVWTGRTNRTSDSLINAAFNEVGDSGKSNSKTIRVYNTTGNVRKEIVRLDLPASSKATTYSLVNHSNKEVLTQTASSANGNAAIYFQAEVPAVGYNTYTIVSKKSSPKKGATAYTLADGNLVLETDLYKIVLDKTNNSIKCLLAKTANNREFVDTKNERAFNELSGNFFDDGGFHTSSEKPAIITVTEQGPAVITAEIKGMLLTHPYTQTITLKQGDRKIYCNLKINWKGNVGIGSDYKQKGGLDSKDYTKPFYDDSKKLLVLFPLNFSSQKIYKDAPFDVTESKLDNTFFTRWDSIKNNILLHWVDVYDDKNNFGLALLTDHTTTYVHGERFPLGLNVQYSGAGLWGRNYTITGPTEINYALIPHEGKWDQARISFEAVNWNEPLVAAMTPNVEQDNRSLVDITGTGYEVTAILSDGNDLLVRLFNAEGTSRTNRVIVGGIASSAKLVELNNAVKGSLQMQKATLSTVINISMPRFGIRTIRLKNFKAY